MQMIAFDSHKRYTVASVQSKEGKIIKEARINHGRGNIVRLSSAPRKIAYSQLLSCDHAVRRFLRKNPSFVPHAFMQPQSSLITDDMMKLIKRADGHAELYDLKRDLYETRDLSEDATYAQQKEALLQLLGKSH